MYIALLAVLCVFAMNANAQYTFDSTSMGALHTGVNASGTIFGNDTSKPVSSFNNTTADFFDYLGIWMLGEDAGSTFAAINLPQEEECWPGPIDTVTRIARDPLDWNSVWIVSKSQVEAHVRHYSDEGYQVPRAIKEWPAAYRDQFVQPNLAPYVDWNQNDIYDPENGDYPAFEGDKVIYTISNDQYGEHLNSGTDKMIIEQLNKLYVFDDQDLSHVIFGTTYFINRSTREYKPFYVGHYADFRLGNDTDNRIFTDVDRALFGAYNGDQIDEGRDGFGETNPVAGICYLNTPIYSTSTFISGDAVRSAPGSTSEYLNVFDGLWKDGEQKAMSADGTGSGSATRYIYPGDTDPANATLTWSEENSGEAAGARTGLVTAKVASLAPRDYFRLDYAIITDTSDQGKNRILELADFAKNRYRSIASVDRNEPGVDPSNLIYPNPIQLGSEWLIDKEVNLLRISDYLGRVVEEFSAEEIKVKKYRLPCSEKYRPGVYTVNMLLKGRKVSSKLVITDN